MFCRYCGTANPADSRFCRICGRGFEVTTTTPPPFSNAPVMPLPGIPVDNIPLGAQNIPMVQGTPQINQVPYVQGTPYSLDGHPGAASNAPLSPSAPQNAMNSPQASAPSVPHQVIHHHPGSHPHPVHHPHLHPETQPHPHAVHNPHPHLEPPQYAGHNQFTQPLRESQTRPTSMQSSASQQMVSTGAKVAGHISRRAFLIALGSVATVAVGAGAYVYVNNAISTPEKTISNFLDAIKRRDGQTAFGQLSSRLQSQENEQQYISNINLLGGFIGSYNISNVQQNDTTTTATVSITAFIITANYSVALVIENGVWKIDGGTLINYH